MEQTVSDNTVDVRTKLSPEYHQALSIIAQVTGNEIAEIVRILIHSFVDERVREANLISNALPREVISGHGRERSRKDHLEHPDSPNVIGNWKGGA